jgi:hypothetical protein
MPARAHANVGFTKPRGEILDGIIMSVVTAGLYGSVSHASTADL